MGTTGVIGVVTASVQLSRRARLRRSIAAARDASALLAPESPNRRVLQQAIEIDVLRLAAMSLIGFTARLRYLAIAFLVASLASMASLVVLKLSGIDLASIAPFPTSLDAQPFLVRLGAIALVVVFLIGLPGALIVDFWMQMQRESLVAEQMTKNVGIVMTPDLLRYQRQQRSISAAAAWIVARRAKKSAKGSRSKR